MTKDRANDGGRKVDPRGWDGQADVNGSSVVSAYLAGHSRRAADVEDYPVSGDAMTKWTKGGYESYEAARNARHLRDQQESVSQVWKSNQKAGAFLEPMSVERAQRLGDFPVSGDELTHRSDPLERSWRETRNLKVVAKGHVK
jgi:hypothetical protein